MIPGSIHTFWCRCFAQNNPNTKFEQKPIRHQNSSLDLGGRFSLKGNTHNYSTLNIHTSMILQYITLEQNIHR